MFALLLLIRLDLFVFITRWPARTKALHNGAPHL